MPGWFNIPVVTTIPLANVEIPNALIFGDGNALEVRGKVATGSTKLYLMRKFVPDPAAPTVFQWQPVMDDVAIAPVADAAMAGWFWDRYWLPESPRGEAFALYNPAGALAFTGTVTAREIRY